MKKHFSKIFIFVLLPVLVLSSCAQQQSGINATEGDAMRFENYGREVVINKRPERVLTLGPNCTELFVALGLEDFIVGTTLQNHSRGPLPEYEETYKNIPVLNYGSATREAVISSGADFIYGIDWEFGEEGLDLAELENYGITVYQNKAATLEQQYDEILDIGTIFGAEERAQAYVEDQKARIAAVRDKISGLKEPNVLVYDSGTEGVFTCGGTNFESLLIELAGGKNLFDDLTEKQWATVSYEEVIARNPDVIVIHDYDSPSVDEKIAEIKSNPMLAQLDCVKNERFTVIELESVLPGNRMAYAVERLAKDFFPDEF